MIRRALFALMLIGAAFVGGAAINGPGLAWLQRNFAGGPSIIVDSIASVRPDPSGQRSPKQFPTASKPPLVVEIPKGAPPSTSKPKPKKVEAELALNDMPLMPESPSAPASALAPIPSAEPTPINDDDPPIPPLPQVQVQAKPQAPEPARLPRLATPPKSDPITRLASVDRAEHPSPNPTPTATAPAPGWADLRRRMKALGVSRYTIEGETDGRVRFRCVIPVDGLKAIAHQFEAEGDDESQAAEAALKRITLWKATSPSD